MFNDQGPRVQGVPQYVFAPGRTPGIRLGSGGQLNEMAARWARPDVMRGFDPTYVPTAPGAAPMRPSGMDGGGLEGFGGRGVLGGQPNEMLRRSNVYGPKSRTTFPPQPTAPSPYYR